jgi:uncharacterized membrane protein
MAAEQSLPRGAARSIAAAGGAASDNTDPVMQTFDRGVALAAYGLLFISPFMFGAPAIAGLGMAYAHKDDAHSLIRSHYRFQIRIFWTTLVCLVIGIALAVGGGGLALGAAYHLLRETFPHIGLPVVPVGLPGNVAAEESWLFMAGVAFVIGGLAYILIAAFYGFLKLLAGRPIRHRNA